MNNLISLPQQAAQILNQPQQLFSSTWVEIDPQAFAHNIAMYKKVCTPALFAPVIKSNAYGHGIELIAQMCETLPAVDFIAVASLDEAVQLRMHGIKKPILVLSIVQGDLAQAVLHDIRLVVYNYETVHALEAAAQQLGKKAIVHIKLDTGLSRLGVLPAQAIQFVEQVYQLPHINIEGIFTHFADSENEDQTFVAHQLLQFNFVIDHLAARGITIPLRHTTCSAAATMAFQAHGTLVRAGVGTYGLWPSQDTQRIAMEKIPQFSLKPVLTWKTSIIHLKEIPVGGCVGYDRTFTAQRVTKIATLPIGYWDGYDRSLSNNGLVIVRGKQAPIVGRVAMNLTMVDVTDIVDVALADEVLLLGDYPGVRAEDLAARCGTINYEIVTRINPLIPRIIREKNR